MKGLQMHRIWTQQIRDEWFWFPLLKSINLWKMYVRPQVYALDTAFLEYLPGIIVIQSKCSLK